MLMNHKKKDESYEDESLLMITYTPKKDIIKLNT